MAQDRFKSRALTQHAPATRNPPVTGTVSHLTTYDRKGNLQVSKSVDEIIGCDILRSATKKIDFSLIVARHIIYAYE